MTSRLNPGSRPLGCGHTHTEYSPTIDRRVCLDCSRVLPGGASKYGAQRITVDGITFPSKREAARWMVLSDMQRCGEISELRRQVPFPIQIGCTVVCTYIADAVYQRDGERVIEDCKGFATPVFRLKKRLMAAVYGVEVLET